MPQVGTGISGLAVGGAVRIHVNGGEVIRLRLACEPTYPPALQKLGRAAGPNVETERITALAAGRSARRSGSDHQATVAPQLGCRATSHAPWVAKALTAIRQSSGLQVCTRNSKELAPCALPPKGSPNLRLRGCLASSSRHGLMLGRCVRSASPFRSLSTAEQQRGAHQRRRCSKSFPAGPYWSSGLVGRAVLGLLAVPFPSKAKWKRVFARPATVTHQRTIVEANNTHKVTVKGRPTK